MTIAQNWDYAKILGSRLLSEANDLKRTPEIMAAELGLEVAFIRSAFAGETGDAEVQALARRMAEVYPISLASIWLEPDDTVDGIKYMPAAEAHSTARVIPRSLPDGRTVPYFEYWDTAMSRTAPFKPEVVRQLHVVHDSKADNPAIAFNKGHLMHQLTFYVGEVNFYWKVNGEPRCAEMNTGDSSYVVPFVPHSFTSRNPEKPGYIIAVTYAGPVRFALDDFCRVGPQAADALAGSAVDQSAAFLTVLDRHLAAESLSRGQLTERLTGRGIARGRAEALTSGRQAATESEIAAMAACLCVRPKDLMASPGSTDGGVVVARAADRVVRGYPDGNRPSYRLAELARTPYQPQLKAFELIVLAEHAEQSAGMRHGLHEYIFNYGEAEAILHHENGRQFSLGPGDSAYVRPTVGRRFTRRSATEEPSLLIVRIPGAMTEAAIEEFGGFDPSGRHRVTGESTRWY